MKCRLSAGATLKKINTNTRKLQSELKRVDRLLKLNPGNINLVHQKQELLKQSVSETKTKLDALRQAQRKLNAEGLDEANSDYRRIQREIQETETKLKALTAEQTLGMDLSTATGIFYRQALRAKGLPFEIKIDEPNEVTYAAMEAASKGEEVHGPFNSVAELMESLNA